MVDVETKAFFTSLGINGAIAIGVLLIFCWLRSKYDDVYEPRRQQKWRKDIHSEPPAVRPGLFGWITHTYQLTDDQVYQTAGLDAVMYVKFFGLVCRLFIFSMIPALLIWLPVNQTDNNLIADPSKDSYVMMNTTVYNTTTGRNETVPVNVTILGYKSPDDFSTLSLANLHNGSNRLLLPLLGLWLFTFYALYLCRNMWLQYMRYRHLYLSQQQSSGKSLSLLVHNLPVKSTTQSMTDFFKSLYPTTFVSAVVSQNVGNLPKLIAERDTAIAKLERAHYDAEHAKPGASPPQAATKCLCCGKVDAIEHWEATIQRLNDEIAILQVKEKPYYGSGFVTFNSSFIVSSLSKLDQTAIPYEYQCNRAPDADDVYHPNLRMNRYERAIRTILFTLATYALVLFWIFPVAFAASFANLKALAEKAAFLSFINSIPEGLLGLIQGYMPAIILAIFYFLLPIILLAFARNQGIEGHTWQSISVVKKMFIFMVVNYFLVFAISGSLFNQLAPILEKPLNLPSILGVALPSQANAFATIILFKGLAGFPVQSLQIGNLVGITILRKYLAKTEREKYNASKPADMNYSAAYPNHLFILILGCVYVVMAPIITVFASIYFSLGYLICKYQAVYMIMPVRESGGRHWPVVFGRIIASLIVGQLTMIGLFGVKEYAPAAILSIPVPIITYYYYHSLMNAYTNKCDFLPVKDAVATDATRIGKDVGLAESRIQLLEEKTNDDGTSSSSTITRRHTHIDPYTQTELLIGKATIPKNANWSNRDLNDPFIISSSEENHHEGSVQRGTDGMAIVHITRKPTHSESETQQVEIHHNSSM